MQLNKEEVINIERIFFMILVEYKNISIPNSKPAAVNQ